MLTNPFLELWSSQNLSGSLLWFSKQTWFRCRVLIDSRLRIYLLGQPKDVVRCSWPSACVDLQRSCRLISAAGETAFRCTDFQWPSSRDSLLAFTCRCLPACSHRLAWQNCSHHLCRLSQPKRLKKRVDFPLQSKASLSTLAQRKDFLASFTSVATSPMNLGKVPSDQKSPLFLANTACSP